MYLIASKDETRPLLLVKRVISNLPAGHIYMCGFFLLEMLLKKMHLNFGVSSVIQIYWLVGLGPKDITYDHFVARLCPRMVKLCVLPNICDTLPTLTPISS